MPPLHDTLNVGLLDVTHKLHGHLKAHVILIKPMVPKMLGEVEATEASLIAISGKKKKKKDKA